MWCLTFLAVALMILDHRYHHLKQLREFLSNAAYPLQWAVHIPVELNQNLQKYFSGHHSLLSENQSLKEKIFEQEGRLQRLLAVEAENHQLRSLLQASPKGGETLSVTEILKVDSDPFHHRILLNKGAREGVYVGQPIIDEQGVVGEIIDVFWLSSRAILVTDASHAIPVENLRNGTRGIAVGTGAIDNLQLQHVPTTADLQVGDVLVTSGLGGRFPAGYPVGKITEISKDAGESFAVVRVKPMAHLDRGRHLLLIQQKIEDQKSEDADAKN